MEPYTLHIKNMVCPRCIKVVKDELQLLQLPVKEVRLGEALLERKPSEDELSDLKGALSDNGFELLEDKKAGLVEQIKVAVIELIQSGKVENLQVNVSDYLANVLEKDYNYLSSLFSTEEGLTIARYVVLQKVERIKELISYHELTFSEIAYQLGYSSVAHLSNQFKQVTGITPSDFKNSTSKFRKPLDRVE